jgi:hypothetical protein
MAGVLRFHKTAIMKFIVSWNITSYRPVYLGSMLTNNGNALVKLNQGLVWQKLHLTRRGLFLLAKLLELWKKLVKCCIWSIAVYIEGKITGGIEVTGRRGRRLRKLLNDLKERREYSHLKKEALDRTMWRARFGRGFGPVVRQNTK